jgi:olfactory receptor
MYFLVGVFGFLPISGILFSYYKIIFSILRDTSTDGKYKAFSTCKSHLSNVCLFYGTSLGVYLSSVISHSLRKVMVASVLYTLVAPMLNPFIYSLGNRDVRGAMRKIIRKTLYSEKL